MTLYDDYKPLRNYLRQLPLLDSLGVVRAYVQYLQLKQPLPHDIEVNPDFLNSPKPQKFVYEWELELLAKEIIINCPESGGKTLRSWPKFATAINKMKEFEQKVYLAYRELHKQKILLELYRLAHRQFPWQRPPNNRTLLRYFKIFGTADFAPILQARIGINASELYTIGLASTGNYIDRFAFDLPIRIEIPGITPEAVECFIQHFSIDMATLKQKMVEAQSYDQDYAYAFNLLRTYPLVRVELNRKPSLIAPIPTFLFQRFTEGVYYEIYGAAEFSAAFGPAFQNYVGEVLKITTPREQFTILAEQPYQIGRDRKDSVDWIVSDASGDLFIECKTKKLRYGAKIGLASTNILDEDLNKMADFIIQIYKTLIDALNGNYTHWNCREGKSVYPMIVTLEEWFAFGSEILPVIDKAVLQKMSEERIDPTMLEQHPYTICSIEDLELAMQIIAQTGINSFTRKRVTGEQKFWPVYSFLRSEFRDEYRNVRGDLFPEDMQRIHPAII